VKRSKHACVLAALLASHACLAAAPNAEPFEKSIYDIAQVRHFSLTPEARNLSDETKANILAAKSVLVSVLKAVQDRHGHPLRYLSTALKELYPTPRKFAAAVLAPETSVIGVMVDQFDVSADGAEIQLQCAVIVHAEGSISTSDMSTTFRKEGADWKLHTFKF
jgi:hypothetical protein